MPSLPKHFWGSITTATSAIGTLRTIIAVGSGRDFTVQQLAFYFGAAAIILYLMAFIVLMAGGLIVMSVEHLLGQPLGDKALFGWMAVGLVPAVVIAAVVVSGDIIFNFEAVDAIGRGAVGLIGISAIAGGAYLQRRRSTAPS